MRAKKDPDRVIMRYGGNIPGQEPGTAVFCCPDVDTINVFKIEVCEED